MEASQTQKLAQQAIAELVAAVEAGQSARLQAYLAMLARFHRYSWGNVLLIYTQCPRASHVAGYRTWQRLGRQVRRGAKGIQILAPIVRKDPEKDDEEMIVTFRTTHVFDVSQTSGEPLPEFARVKGDPDRHLERLRALVRASGISLGYSVDTAGAEGISAGGAITIKAGLKPAEEFAVLAHEFAHERLHRDKKTRTLSRTVRETEAEAVAFVVCQAIGLDTNNAAADYVV